MNKRITLAFREFILILILYIILPSFILAQALYPVTAILDVQGPYSPVFSTFSDPSNQAFRPNKMALRLRLNDLNEASLAVRLKWEISGPGIEFQTNDDFLGGIANLISGQYITLDNAALTPYFDLFGSSGISDEFVTGTGGYLPEGSYSFCVTAFELIKGQQVSNTSCREIYIEEYEPPFLNNPSGSITPTFPQNLQISWTPRHFGVFPVIYNVKIWETFEGLTPDQVVSSQMPYITLDVNQVTQTFLNSQNGLLTPGRSYLAQVQIRDGVNGPFGMPSVIFKNNGNSEVLAFTYGEDDPEGVCTAPLEFKSELDDQQNVVLFWQESDPTLAPTLGRSTQVAYQIKYREVGITEWQIKETSVRTLLMTGLRQGETYEIELYKVCLNGLTAGGALKVLVPKRNKARTLPDCGEEMDISGMSEVPLERLAVNDTIFASGTEVIVQEVAGSGGVFTGKGFIRLPLLSTVKIAVEFDAISVNEDFELTAGEIRTVYNPLAGNVANINFGSDNLTDFPTLEYQDSFKIISLTADGTLIYLDGREVLVNGAYIKGKGLNEFVFSGERFDVFEEYEKFDSLGPVRVKFAASGNQRFGFDAYKPAIDKEYEKYFDLPVSYKSVAEGAFDEVEVFVEGGLEEGDTIVFVDELTKAELQFSPKGVSTKYRVNAMGPGKPSAIIAYVINKGVAGKLNIYSTPITKVPIKIVNVNGVSGNSAGVESTINKIFAPGLFKVEVLGQDDFDYVEKEDGIINVENHFLNAYSPDMKKLADEYFKTKGQLDETFYLFISDKLEASTQGLMPQGYAAGFISSTASAQVYAHELAHGIFNFDHSWLMYGLDSMKTQNLMDYSGGTELWYRQWKQMVSPGFPKGWRKDEKDGKYDQITSKEAIKLMYEKFGDKENGTLSFYKYDGKLITFKADKLEGITFTSGENYTLSESFALAPIGALSEATYDGKMVFANYNNLKIEYEDTLSTKVEPKGGLVAYNCFENDVIKSNIFQLDLPIDQPLSFDGLISSYLSERISNTTDNHLVVDGNLAIENKSETTDYLSKRKPFTGCNSALAPYIMVVATILSQHPEMYHNCLDDGNSILPFFSSKGSENFHSNLIFNEIENNEMPRDEIGKSEPGRLSSIQTDLIRMKQVISDLERGMDELISQRANLLQYKSYSELYNYLESQLGDNCVWPRLTLESRKYAIQMYFDNSSFIPGSKSNLILLELLQTTLPGNDRSKLLDFLATENLLYRFIEEKLEFEFESAYAKLIISWIDEIYAPKTNEASRGKAFIYNGSTMQAFVQLINSPYFDLNKLVMTVAKEGSNGNLSFSDYNSNSESFTASYYNPILLVFKSDYANVGIEGESYNVSAFEYYYVQQCMKYSSKMKIGQIILETAVFMGTVGTSAPAFIVRATSAIELYCQFTEDETFAKDADYQDKIKIYRELAAILSVIIVPIEGAVSASKTSLKYELEIINVSKKELTALNRAKQLIGGLKGLQTEQKLLSEFIESAMSLQKVRVKYNPQNLEYDLAIQGTDKLSLVKDKIIYNFGTVAPKGDDFVLTGMVWAAEGMNEADRIGTLIGVRYARSSLEKTGDLAVYKVEGSSGLVIKQQITLDWTVCLGKFIDNLSEAPQGYQIFIKNGSKYIRRIDISDINTPRLMVDETGAIVKYVKPQRLAISGKLRTNLEKLYGTAPENHQAHHIVPSNVVDKSPLHKEAIKRGLFDVDRASNGRFLAESDEDFILDNSGLSENYPTHFGSHPNYDIQITKQIDDIMRANNLSNTSDLFDLTNEKLINMIFDIEDLSLNVLENWRPSKLN